jgi:hypothetical protein
MIHMHIASSRACWCDGPLHPAPRTAPTATQQLPLKSLCHHHRHTTHSPQLHLSAYSPDPCLHAPAPIPHHEPRVAAQANSLPPRAASRCGPAEPCSRLLPILAPQLDSAPPDSSTPYLDRLQAVGRYWSSDYQQRCYTGPHLVLTWALAVPGEGQGKTQREEHVKGREGAYGGLPGTVGGTGLRRRAVPARVGT